MKTLLSQSVTTQLANKRIVILGIGITGLSCARFLHGHQLPFAVNDSRAMPISPGDFKQQFADNRLVLGHWDSALIAQAEVLIVSPGIDLATPEINDAISVDCDVIGDIELFCRLSDTPIIAVTGSNGKSTVVSMLNYLGKALNYQVQLGGNIGLPVLDQIAQDAVDVMILELSSFQLETIRSMKPLAATVLNVSDDHLDRHKSLANYSAIKQRIYKNATYAVYNRQDQATTPTANYQASQMLSFGADQPTSENLGLAVINGDLQLMHGKRVLCALADLPLQGIHNALNYLAVLALGHCAGWDITAMLSALKSFKGLAHRCELIASNDGIRWINDSKATNVGATLAAIQGLAPSLQGKQLFLIAGGDGKGADFQPLAQAIQTQVDYLITLGKDGQAIADLRLASQVECTTHVSSLAEAVTWARKRAQPGDMVLLSPACASLDMFANYVERGVVFIKSVLLQKEHS
ncbi:UDP-N-acetylmuramoylalanine--D-glutamate ligase [Colwellia chukchiensis]|uniref:UDP-N-acetylmuramoylalanine--D-glutamate ligase n=1 Tax=Colwellia chukchiensis TaxID=641665 RepID=A0A1H7L4P7_9GAMM|nr:UDP-N-acetylmuramoyl-L-alanine--D-glutamate ligase [Colwellia chukchiensis]SEK94009.1 UDP-N-acetylmuramoylalanine--D-glutamate ligase [Colwellia chukchiensis]